MCIPEKVECQQLTKQNDSLMWTDPGFNIHAVAKLKVQLKPESKHSSLHVAMLLFYFLMKRETIFFIVRLLSFGEIE